jgi:hypothetical protein
MRLFVFNQLQFRLQNTVFKFDLAQSTRKLSLFLFKKYSGASTIFGIYLHFTLLLEAKLCDFLYSISYNLMYERQF